MQARRFGRIVGGTALMGAGAVSLALPILPGVLIMVAGLGVLAPEVPAAQKTIDRMRAGMNRSG